MDIFSMDEKKEYVIYGAGGDCRRIMETFKKSGFKAACIIDRRAGTLGFLDGIPVSTLEDYKSKNPENIVIVISIKNVFEHTDIARKLLAKGYDRLIYKPLPILQGRVDEEWESISNAYDCLLVKREMPKRTYGIAKSRSDHLVSFQDKLMIRQEGEEALCFAPAELICNYNTRDAYGGMHMSAYYPLVNLYKYLLGYLSNVGWMEVKRDFLLYSAEWVNKVKEDFTKDLEKSLIHSRIGIFNEMQKNAEIDADFFIRNAVRVKPGDAMQLYLESSGRNRVAFMVAKGYRFIPVKMDRADYERWKNKECVRSIISYLEKNGISSFFAMTPNPVLASFQTDIADYTRLFCMPVIGQIIKCLHWQAVLNVDGYLKVDNDSYQKKKKELKVLADLDDMGIMGRCIAAENIHCWRTAGRHEELEGLLDELLYIENSRCLHRMDERDDVQKFDILVTDLKSEQPLYEESRAQRIFVLEWEDNELSADILKAQGYQVKQVLFRTVWRETQVKGIMMER